MQYACLPFFLKKDEISKRLTWLWNKFLLFHQLPNLTFSRFQSFCSPRQKQTIYLSLRSYTAFHCPATYHTSYTAWFRCGRWVNAKLFRGEQVCSSVCLQWSNGRQVWYNCGKIPGETCAPPPAGGREGPVEKTRIPLRVNPRNRRRIYSRVSSKRAGKSVCSHLSPVN